MFLNYFWYLLRSDLKRFSITSSALPLILIYLSSLFTWIKRFSSLSLDEIKLVAIVNGAFYISTFWDYLFFKYGITLLRYFSTDNIYFYHNYFHIKNKYYPKNYLILLYVIYFIFQSKKISYIFNVIYLFFST